MIRAIIVEDEPGNVRLFQKLLETYCPIVSAEGVAENIDIAYELIKTHKPDLVFLDIEMPGGNTFTLLDRLKPLRFDIIFVTAYNDYTLKAIKYSALDYLLKPVNIEELIAAVNKVVEKLSSRQLQQRIESLFSNLEATRKTQQSLAVPAHFGYEFIFINNIIRCEANGKYTYFFMSDGRKIVSVKNLKEYEDILSPDVFFRIHHSHLINIHFVKRYHKNDGTVEMEDGMTIPLATRRKKEFLSIFVGEE